MANKKRLGDDTFSWLRDTRGEGGPSAANKESRTDEKIPTPTQAEILKQSATTKTKKRRARQGQGARRVITKTSQEGLPNNWTRATFIMREDLLEKFKDVAYWDRKPVKELFDEMLQKYIAHRQKKDGAIKSRPKSST